MLDRSRSNYREEKQDVTVYLCLPRLPDGFTGRVQIFFLFSIVLNYADVLFTIDSMEYPELIRLKNMVSTNKLAVRAVEPPNVTSLFKVLFSSGNHSWEIFIEDECGDYNENNQLLCVFLVLIALEDYEVTKDYPEWCTQYGLDSAESKWLNYYRELNQIYNSIKDKLGSVDSCISPFDQELRSGAFAELLAATK